MADSKAPRKTKPAAEPKPARKKHPRRADGRKRDDLEWHGNKAGEQNPAAITALKKANYLKQLIEPKTESMINVMYELAMGQKVDKDGNIQELNVHPSIRLEAASRLLDRAYGKPKEHLQIDDPEGGSADKDEVTALLNNILTAVGAPTLEADVTQPSETGASDAG